MYHALGWKIVLAMAILVVCVMGCGRHGHVSEASENDDVSTFLQRHWRVPIPLQGIPPTSYSPLEVSLHPRDCGVCHPQQYKDWKTSVHSRSMGPGVYGQLFDMDPATVIVCATCHTPLSEQLPHRSHEGAYETNNAFDAALQKAGLVCAACHVRQHLRYGPPRRPDLPPLPEGTPLPHAGFTESVAFQRAEFCRGCHQFKPDDFALNGKLLENTYEEWKQSPYAKQGVQCQSCHMPDRRHLWRGIHDADMVRNALSVTLSPDVSAYKPGDQMQTTITVTNTGAGHYLPTYVTPKIFVQAHLLDAQGQMINGTAQEAAIGREITLDLSEEKYDTRIPPQASRTFAYGLVAPNSARKMRLRLVVHPDHFYQRFFEAVLQDGGSGQGRTYLEEALRVTQSSSFTVFDRELPLSASPQTD